MQREELDRFRDEEKRLAQIAGLAERDAELARRLARLEEEENNNNKEGEHDESLAIELAEREREIQRIKKVCENFREILSLN